jgi:predicted esterase
MISRSLFFLVVLCFTTSASAQHLSDANAPEGITVTRDIVYGEALVGKAGGGHLRNLVMDVYAPLGVSKNSGGRAAILMAFGGSFHRGDKAEGHFQEDGAHDSSMADYCRTFARRGYVCFSMEYRLTQENPVLAKPIDLEKLMPQALAITPTTTARVDFSRQQMGLPALDDAGRDQLWRAILAASEDMGTAIAHIQQHANKYGVDPDRLAIGGFSAGAITAINTAYGADAPVKAVVSISGSSWGYNLAATAKSGHPPLLVLVGQNDLPGVRGGSAQIAALFGLKGIKCDTAWVANFGHFYPMGAVSLAPDLTKLPVSERILDFLDSNLQPTP